MLDPCGPEMTAVFWAIVRGLFYGIIATGLIGLFDTIRRRLLGETWNYQIPEVTTAVMVVVVVAAVVILWEVCRQFG